MVQFAPGSHNLNSNHLTMPVKRTRGRSRKTRRAPMRKRNTTRSKKPAFRQQALNILKTTPTAKTRYETVVNTTTQLVLGTKELDDQDLTNIQTTGGIDGRTNESVRIKGYRIRFHFVNNLLSPLIVNVAMVIPRQQTADFKTSFFRQLGLSSTGPVEKGIDFDSTSLSGIMYATLPINTDEFGVIWHTRFKLGVPSTSLGFSSGELKNYRSLYRYIPINRDLQWRDRNDSGSALEKVWMLVWCAGMFEVAAGASVPGALDYQCHHVAVFDNKNNS